MSTPACDATISARSRNLGIGWTTAAASDYPSGYHYEPAGAPPIEDRGGPAAVRRTLRRINTICGYSTYYRADLFVGGQRVTHWRTSPADPWLPTDHDPQSRRELIGHAASGFDGEDGPIYRADRLEVRLS